MAPGSLFVCSSVNTQVLIGLKEVSPPGLMVGWLSPRRIGEGSVKGNSKATWEESGMKQVCNHH